MHSSSRQSREKNVIVRGSRDDWKAIENPLLGDGGFIVIVNDNNYSMKFPKLHAIIIKI